MADKFLNLEGLAEVAEKVNSKLRVVTTMPTSSTIDDIVKYNGTTSAKYQQGSTYIYKQVGTFYKWADLSDDYYTLSATPAIGDTVYSDTLGTDSGYTISAYDSILNQVTINSLIYDRDTTGDAPLNDWVPSLNITGYAPSFLDTSLVFTYGVLPEVENNSLIFDLDN